MICKRNERRVKEMMRVKEMACKGNEEELRKQIIIIIHSITDPIDQKLCSIVTTI
jgi:hypothetical protein